MSRSTWRTYVCKHVLEGAPALVLLYDGGDDASLQATCGSEAPHPPGSFAVMAWGCLLRHDPTLAPVDEMLAPDTWYLRTSVGAPWVVEAADPAELYEDEPAAPAEQAAAPA